MEALLELAKILLPASLVLYAVFLVVKSFLNKEYEKKLIEIKMENTKIVLPIRLQAYERMCLFLERITLNNLILRVNDPMFTSGQLQQRLLLEIRNEFNHNLSQQIYMSDEAWNMVKKAIEDLLGLVNTSAQMVDSNSKGIELAKKMFENMLQKENDSTQSAIVYLKNEIRVVF